MVLDRPTGQVHIPIQIKTADTFVSRLLGFMFRSNLPEDEGLRILPCNSIHMFFMRFAIDAVFLDKDGVVLKAVPDLQPWSMIPPVRSAHSTLELSAGTIAKYEIRTGDRISDFSLQK